MQLSRAFDTLAHKLLGSEAKWEVFEARESVSALVLVASWGFDF